MTFVESFSRADDAVMRRAVRADVPSLARVYLRSQGQIGAAADRHGITYEPVVQWLLKTIQRDDVWLLEREHGEIVGVLAVTGNELDVLDVEPGLRDRGYGARLMDIAKTQRPGGLVARVGSRRLEARRFLEHHGFTPTSDASRGVDEMAWGPLRGNITRGRQAPR